MRTDLVVVGAGPAGGMAALAAARGGLRVALVDRKRVVGEPVQCAEGVSRFALESNGLRPDPRFVRQEVRGARGVVPSGRGFDITRLPGYAVDRAEFDRSIADAAVAAGAELSLGERARGLVRADGEWEVRAGSRTWRAPNVIAADGPAGLVSRWAGLLTSAESMRAYEWRFDAADVPSPDPNRFLLYFARRYEGGYAWIFPRGSEVNVGVGGHLDAHAALVAFCRERGIDPVRKRLAIAGQLPYRFTFTHYAANGVAVVGDAAGVTNPLDGGGIHAALYSGRVAGELAAAGRLDAYDAAIRGSPFLDPVLWTTADAIRAWDDRVLNFVGDVLERQDWRTLSAARAFRAALRYRGVLRHAGELVRMRRALAITEIYGW